MFQTGIQRSLLSPVSWLVELLGYMSATWLSPTRCALAVGELIHGFEYFGLITLESREFRVLLVVLPACLQCLRIFGLVSVAWCCDPTFIAFIVVLVWCFCSVCADCADDSSAGSCASLARCCRRSGFVPNSAVFALVLGTFVLASEF